MQSGPLTSALLYGAFGIGKSTQLALAASHIWKTTGKKTRVIGADGGGSQNALAPLGDVVEYLPIDQWEGKSIFYVLDRVTRGWWPSDPSTPNSPLVPCVREWKPCPLCGGDSGAKGHAMVPKCSSCGKAYPPGTTLKTQRDPINGLEDVGLVGFEGLTSFGDLLLRRLRLIDPSGGRTVQDGPSQEEGSFTIAAPGKQHFGDAQAYIQQFVANTRLIPVPIILWTALEIRADDDGVPVYGPALPGKKLTSRCGAWFTDVLHLDGVVKKDPKGTTLRDADGIERVERKLFLAPHFASDRPGVQFMAKTSAPFGGEMPLSMEADIRVYFKALETAKEKASRFLLGS